MPSGELRERCQRAVDGLSVPTPFDSARFLAALGEQLGKRIELVPVRLAPNAPCGALISTDDTEWIFCPDNTTAVHAEHIMLHEVGHLVLGHQGNASDALGDEVADRLLPDLSPALIRRLLGRTVYQDEDERAAELFATLVLARAERGPARCPEPEIVDGLARLSSAFGSAPRPRRRRR